MVVKATDSEPRPEKQYVEEAHNLTRELGVRTYLAVVNEIDKKKVVSKELFEKMDFPDDDYIVTSFVMPRFSNDITTGI